MIGLGLRLYTSYLVKLPHHNDIYSQEFILLALKRQENQAQTYVQVKSKICVIKKQDLEL